MQIGTSGLEFGIVGEKVSVADAIRRPKNSACVNGIDERRVPLRKWLAGNRRIIQGKCRIKSRDSVERERKESPMSDCQAEGRVGSSYLANLSSPDEAFITSRPMIPQT
jgi:hypothetical protein